MPGDDRTEVDVPVFDVDPVFDVAVVGSANLDLVAGVDAFPADGQTVRATAYAEHAGGKGLNQSVACARMGARTAFVGSVGDDAAGAHLRELLVSEGVDVTGLRTANEPTGRALITVDSSGENTIVVVAGANGRTGVDAPVHLPAARIVLVQLEIPLAAVADVLTRARTAGAVTVLNPAPAAQIPADVLSLCDVVVPNEGELEVMGGTEALLGCGVGAVVVTMGERGARIVTAGSVESVPAHPVDPVDTVGAGDAFTGAMCAELARGSSLAEACRVAAVAGALATTVRGAVPGIPSRASVRAVSRASSG
jgi:ribokinase